MDLFHACRNHDWKAAIEDLNEMIGSVRPAAIWAILMHVGAWHEERVYDTPHSAIIIHTVKRMIEELGQNQQLLDTQPNETIINISDEVRENFQIALMERLVYYLSEVDHWTPENGPRYGTEHHQDSLDNALNRYIHYIREKRMMGALASALKLMERNDPVRFIRVTSSLAAERPDKYGHAFILPSSLLMEIPNSRFTRPQEAVLWHLLEYLVRKVPSRRPKDFRADDQLSKLANPTDLKKYRDIIRESVVDYGLIGHNTIFAHRIVESSKRGLIDENTVDWLFGNLRDNIGNSNATGKDWESICRARSGADWVSQPAKIKLIHSKYVRRWVSEDIIDLWSVITDFKSRPLEDMIPSIGDNDWPAVRAAQYVLTSLYGHPRMDHTMIFTQAVWSLADREIISRELAVLQAHRMVRENINKI